MQVISACRTVPGVCIIVLGTITETLVSRSFFFLRQDNAIIKCIVYNNINMYNFTSETVISMVFVAKLYPSKTIC